MIGFAYGVRKKSACACIVYINGAGAKSTKIKGQYHNSICGYLVTT